MSKINFTTVGQLKEHLSNYADDLPLVFQRDEDCFVDYALSHTRIDILDEGDEMSFQLEYDEPDEIKESVKGVVMAIGW